MLTAHTTLSQKQQGAMRDLLINTKCGLATAEESKRYWDDLCEMRKSNSRWNGHGSRIATVRCSLEEFADRVGDPHETLPRDKWRNYDLPDSELMDFSSDGKITAIWYFVSPRGLIEVSDYWWNPPTQLSVRCIDLRSMRWFKRWCKSHGFSCEG